MEQEAGSGQRRRRWAAWLLASGAILALSAQAAAPPITATRLPPGAHLSLSGCLDDPHWAAAPAFDGFWQYQPSDGVPAPMRTTVRLLFDDEAVVFGIRAVDAEPDRIRAPFVRRDGVAEDQDFVGLMLDAMGHGKSALLVRVNARGVVSDGIYNADSDETSLAPDFAIDARACPQPDGYAAEIRIPLLALRYAPGSRRAWQVQVLRNVPRAQGQVFTSAPLKQSAISLLAEMNPIAGLDGLADGSGLSVVPGLTLHTSRRPADDPDTAPRVQPSLDLKWRPSAAWIVDATLKPDFSQVEADVPQLQGNLQYALQLEEKRPFFLESSDLLQAPSMMQEQGDAGSLPLYTRSVTQPRWGLRATRRGDDGDLMLLAAFDAGGGSVLLPGTWATQYAPQPGGPLLLARSRWQWDAGEQRGSVGGFVAERRYTAGGSGENRVLGIDGLWRPGPADRLRLMLLRSDTTALPAADGTLQRGPNQGGQFLFADWLRKGETWEPSLTLQRASEGFRNDSGSFGQSGYTRSTAQLVQRHRLGGDWAEVSPYLWFSDTHADASGLTVLRMANPGLYLRGPRSTTITAELRPGAAQRVSETGLLHRFAQGYLEVITNPAPWFNTLTARLTWGGQVDVANDRQVRGRTLLLDASLHPGDRLELRPRIEQTTLAGPGGQGTALRDTALQLVTLWHVDAQRTVRAIAQRQRTERVALAPGDTPDSDSRSRSTSLLFSQRFSATRVAYLGASRVDRDDDGLRRTTSELFVKGQWGW